MAPVRRYLRISKRSVLECRIYLDNPALAKTWLLNSRDPVLPRVIEAVRPLVLPKLREENERSKGKGGKGKNKKGVKDIVVEGIVSTQVVMRVTAEPGSCRGLRGFYIPDRAQQPSFPID